MRISILLLFLGLSAQALRAQEGRKLWLSSYARGLISTDQFETQGQDDTTTARSTQNGQALVDLGLHVQPTKDLEIHAMVRIRNDYGGFWGSGVTLDLRQLWIRGVIADKIRFQLGDLDYKMSPYTFRNEDEWMLGGTATMSATPLDMVRYDLFQNSDETWRQQGVSAETGFQVKRWIDAINLSGFATRVAASDFGAPFDRIYGGGMVELTAAKQWHLRYHYANLFDLSKTSSAPVSVSNPVQSALLRHDRELPNWKAWAQAELGQSRIRWEGDPEAPELEDGFADVRLGMTHKRSLVSLELGWRQVGANFRSPGAQTKRIRYGSAPQAYQRYGNEQVLRALSSYDLLRDASVYNTQLQTGLMVFDPRYGNALPYGTATPNRQGVDVLVGWTDKGGVVELELGGAMLSDRSGQGTDLKRRFGLLESKASLHVDRIFDWERKLELGASWNRESTKRDGDPVYESIDLDNQLLDFNAEWGFWKQLSLLAEWRSYRSNGREQLAIRNDYSQVIDFVEIQTQGTETLLGGGLQYAFNTKIFAQLFYQQFSWEDPLSGNPAYDWGNWQFNFVMQL
jgi:hypothetical protein